MSFTGRDDNFLQTIITNNGFFPNLVLGDLQKIYRIPASAPAETVMHQTQLAMTAVNDELASYQAAWQDIGYETLAEADASVDNQVNGKKKLELLVLYKTAVYSMAKAELLEDFETFTRRDIADNQANQSEKVWQSCKANARKAIRSLKGLTKNVSCELI